VAVAVIGALIYVYAIVTNPRLDSWFYAFGVVALFIGVGVVVARLVGRLSEMAQSDALTGALNRAGLTAAAGLLHDLDERGHVETTVVEIDLDGFKAYNDAHGHAAGDELLTAVVRAWRHELRRTDLLARVGGDEFVIVFPSTSRAEAERLVERLRAASPAQWSAGLSTWLPGDPLPVALESADVDMYAHKPNRRGSSGPTAL
jgi:diguanylate cyclase (GGDEF)-like protein